MAVAQDFIPSEAKIDVDISYIQEDVKNLYNVDEVLTNTVGAVHDYEARFVGQRNEYITEDSGIWNLQDAFFRSGLNDGAVQTQKSKGANEPDTWERAKTGSTLFYRQVRQKASNGYAVQTSKDMPFKYIPLLTDESDSPEHAEERADKLNKLAKWSMKADKFNIKSIEFWTSLSKTGNIPVLIEWIQRTGKKRIRVPQFADDGVTIKSYELEEFNGIVENRPTTTVLPVESVMLDTAIGDVQRQECVIISTVVGMTEIVDGIRTGLYREDLIEHLGRAQQWDGFSGGFENEGDKKSNRGFDNNPTQTGTGQYLKREVFINLPVDEEKETWDEMGNIPKRFRVTMFGNTVHNSIVARIERNQEPDDTIPMAMIHANPDDSDLIYHISDFEVIRSNMATETTLIRHVIDNNTLVCKPPMIEVRGEVDGKDRSFGPNARWTADSINSIKEFNVRDISQPTISVLDYIKEDSNTANSIDKNMIGESFGARTSASEASTISGNSRRPNLVNIEYILEQYLGFHAERYKVLWEAYGRKDQVVQITNDNDELVFVRPTDIEGEYDVIIDIMDDIKDKAVESQRMINYAQTAGSIPQLAQTTDFAGINRDLQEAIFGTAKYVLDNIEEDAESLARINLLNIMNNGLPPQLTERMNLKKHLQIYKEERLRWTGNEDQNPNIGLLDQVIAQVENRIAQQGGGQVTAQATGTPTESVAAGQQISGAIGGV